MSKMKIELLSKSRDYLVQETKAMYQAVGENEKKQ